MQLMNGVRAGSLEDMSLTSEKVVQHYITMLYLNKRGVLPEQTGFVPANP